MSSSLAIENGIPQGSILVPILLVIYINDLPQILLKSSIGMYADDTAIYLSDSSAEIIKKVLQNDLNNFEQWVASSRLVLNQNKTKWMLCGSRQKLEHCSDHKIQLHGKETDRVSSFCYSGVTLDENLSWNEHVEFICNKVSKRLGLLSCIRVYLTLKAARCVYNCFVTPIFYYNDTVWGCQSDAVTPCNVYKTSQHPIQRRATTEESFKMLG